MQFRSHLIFALLLNSAPALADSSYSCKTVSGVYTCTQETQPSKPIDYGKVLYWKPRIGMTKAQVDEAMSECKPEMAEHCSEWLRTFEHVNRTQTHSGTREQWVFSNQKYLYFDNGVLTAIQD